MGGDSTFIRIFKALFSIIPSLIMTVGVIPTMSVLLKLRTYLMRGITFPDLRLLLNNYNPVVVRNILDVISPDWDKCLKNVTLFKNLFNVYLAFVSLGLFRPILSKIFRYSIGLFLSSIGIAWNEALSSYAVLKSISDYVLSFFPDVVSLKNIITTSYNIKDNNLEIEKPIYSLEINEDNTSWLYILGLFILGSSAVIIMLCAGDYVAPSIIRSIPGLETILDSIYYSGNNILSWFSSVDKPSPDLPKLPEPINIPEVISRSSSGSSSSTITPPTPPVSRAGTPLPPLGILNNWE